jgi:hypothetical protein
MDIKYSSSLNFGQNPRWLPGIKPLHIVQKMDSKHFHADFFIDHFQILYNG